MTPVATAEPLPRSLFDGVGGEPTLDDLLVGVWEGLAADERVSCPVCHGEMQPEYAAHALPPDDSGAADFSETGCRARGKPEGGRCAGCGSSLR